MSRTIAFIGLGAMGLPMARRLIERQYRVQGFDLNQQRLKAHEAQGGVPCTSASEACKEADALILMATTAPADAVAIAGMVEAERCRFLDCPVSGGVVGAEAGTLTIMAGGTQATYAAALPYLKTMGDKLFHVGEKAGDGAMVKTINQLLCGVQIAVAAEAFAMAEKAGLDGGLMLRILGQSAAASWMLNNRGPRMLQAEPDVTSAVDIFVKDLSLVLDAGRASKVALPLAAAAHQMFLAASGSGHGAADDSQVIRAYRALNGISR
jgi:L-threonate 2-dehydrogenase